MSVASAQQSVAIVGAGNTGRTLGRLLVRAGWTVDGVSCRTLARARDAAAFIGGGRPCDDPAQAVRGARLVLLAVPDGAIVPVNQSLASARAYGSGAIVAHLCGALPAEALAPARTRDVRVGGLHPLRSFADPALAAERFAGTCCAVDGDPDAVRVLEDLVKAIGGIPLRIQGGSKPLYHAGAVFASNYLVAILEAALRLFERSGVERARALEPVLALARGTLENAARAGIPAALTGPIERGDAATVRAHVEALRVAAPGLAEVYASLARLTCEAALAKGTIDAAAAGRINTELESGGTGIQERT